MTQKGKCLYVIQALFKKKGCRPQIIRPSLYIEVQQHIHLNIGHGVDFVLVCQNNWLYNYFRRNNLCSLV
jgi:hypothetical protein